MWRIVQTDSSKDLINPTTHLFIRFIGDIEADQKISGHASGPHRRYCESTLDMFFEKNLTLVKLWNKDRSSFFTGVNLIAHWINLGYVNEALTRDYIPPSLISHPDGVEALILLFKPAGSTIEAYVSQSMVDHCLDGLKIQYHGDLMEGKLVQVRAETWSLSRDEFSGYSCVTGAWLGGPPSPTCINHWESQASWRRREGSRRDPRHHFSGTPQQRSRPSDSSASFTRTNRYPGHTHESGIPYPTVTVYQYHHPLGFHCRRYL